MDGRDIVIPESAVLASADRTIIYVVDSTDKERMGVAKH